MKDKVAKAAAKKLGLSAMDLKKLQVAALAVWSQVGSGGECETEDVIEIVLGCDFALYCDKLLTPRVREVLDTNADYKLLQAAIRPVFKELYA